ncbi:MAG: hypothetical protein C4542_02125 [Dehalococcoidia bacterium]|nr:MAG: hypothetical protein C4542_02125 [Dehalococcoidia bacterium]
MVKNYKLWLAVTVLLASAAALVTVATVQRYTGTVRVVTAKKDMGAAQVVTGEFLQYEDALRMGLYEDVVIEPQQVAGMVVKGFVPAGTVLRNSMFEPPQNAMMSGKLAALGETYRAVALPKQLSTTVAGSLNEGDIVDIYTKKKNEKKKDEPAVVNIASDVLVARNRYGENESEGLVLAFKSDEIEKVLPYFYEPGDITFVLKPKPKVGGDE